LLIIGLIGFITGYDIMQWPPDVFGWLFLLFGAFLLGFLTKAMDSGDKVKI